MKKLLLIMLLIPRFVIAQNKVNYEVSGDPIKYAKVLTMDSALTKDKLYIAGVEWFAKTYVNGKVVMQMQDKDAGIIIGKAAIIYDKYSDAGQRSVDYIIKLSFKNGKIKYELYDFFSDRFGIMKDGEVTKAPWMVRSALRGAYKGVQDIINNNITSITSSLDKYYTELSPKGGDF